MARRRTHWTAAVVASIVALLVSSCSKHSHPTRPNPTQPNRPVVIPETTKMLDASDMGALVSATSDKDTLVFDGGATRIAALKPGDVIVSDSGEGFLRKVVSVTPSAGQLVVLTGPAALTDAITTGSISIHEQIRASQLKAIRTPYGVGSYKVTEGTGGSIVITMQHIVVNDNDADLSTVNDQIVVDGDIEITPNFHFDCDIVDASVQRVDTGFDGTITATLTAGYQMVGLKFSGEKTLMTVPAGALRTSLGPLGIVVAPEVAIKVRGSVSVGAAFQTTLTASSGFSANVLYVPGGATFSGDASAPSFALAPVDLSVNFDGTLAVGPEISAKVFGIIGPYVYLNTFGQVEGDLLLNPWLTVYGGIGADIGLKLEPLNTAAHDYRREGVVQLRRMLAQSPRACFSLSPPTGPMSTNFQADATCSTDAQDAPNVLKVRWDWDDDHAWDSDYSSTRTASHLFGSPGSKTIRMEVVDGTGLVGATTQVVVVGVGGDNTRPVACFAVTPSSGTTATSFAVDAVCATDAQDASSALQVRWDWDADGTWDTAYSATKTAAHLYSSTGTKTIKLGVKDSGGLTDSTTRTVTVTTSSPPPGGMVLIPAGTFIMGSPLDEPGRDYLNDETQHQVTISKAFYMSDHEVTQAEWQELLGPKYWFNAGDNHPTDPVTWFDAVAYCNARSAREGFTPAYSITVIDSFGFHISNATVQWNQTADGYRLPTESEWEYACRAGSTTAFANGPITDTFCSDPKLDLMGWYCGNSQDWTRDVKGKAPNAWGLYDMHGNVSEWCWDWAGSYPGTVVDPTGPASGTARIRRGGHYYFGAESCRSASRSRGLGSGDACNCGQGVRVVRPAP